MIFILKQDGPASICRPVLPTELYWFYRPLREWLLRRKCQWFVVRGQLSVVS